MMLVRIVQLCHIDQIRHMAQALGQFNATRPVQVQFSLVEKVQMRGDGVETGRLSGTAK